MAFDFAAFLILAAVLTGSVWAFWALQKRIAALHRLELKLEQAAGAWLQQRQPRLAAGVQPAVERASETEAKQRRAFGPLVWLRRKREASATWRAGRVEALRLGLEKRFPALCRALVRFAEWRRARRQARAELPWLVDLCRSFFLIITAVLVLRSFIIEPFRIPSGSMEPTLQAGDFILVNKYAFGVRLPVINTKIIDSGRPTRGDVAVFRYPEDPSVAYIKRIVGLPGDRLEYRNKQLFINGEPVPQSLAPGAAAVNGYEQRIEKLGEHNHLIQVRKGLNGLSFRDVVPPGHYYVLGDNRDNSRDSRFWGFLPESNLIGKAFFIWMNLDCLWLKGHCDRIGGSIQ